jgi:hypothetical protein
MILGSARSQWRRTGRLVIGASLLVLLVSCTDSSSPKSMIIGKWKNEREGLTVEFVKDGKIIVSSSNPDWRGPKTGKYSFLDDRRLKYELDESRGRSEVVGVKSVTSNSLEFETPSGLARFTRMP